MKLPGKDGADGSWELDSPAMAALVDRELRVRTPDGPGRLCGFSTPGSTPDYDQRRLACRGRQGSILLQVDLEDQARGKGWYTAAQVVRHRAGRHFHTSGPNRYCADCPPAEE